MRWDSIRFDGVGILLHLLRFPLPAFRFPPSALVLPFELIKSREAGIKQESTMRKMVGLASKVVRRRRLAMVDCLLWWMEMRSHVSYLTFTIAF
jgi:hypothetical protein